MKHTIRNLFIVLGIGLATGCAEEPAAPVASTRADSAPTMEVAERTLPSFIVVDGRVAAKNQVEVATRMMARISAVPVDVGDRVAKGTVLVRLGTDDIEANRASAEAAVAAARLAAEEARRHAARMDTLLSVDAVPLVQRDQARLQLAAAESQLVMAESGLRNVETAAGYATIVAPFSGTVVSRFADPGDMAAPGVPLLVIQDAAAREGRIAVPASALEHLAVGTPIEVASAGFEPITVEITSISSGVDPMTGTVEVVTSLPKTWIPGTTLTAQVPVGTRAGIAVPESSVVRRGQLTGVRVAGDDGAAIRWVRLGRRVQDADMTTPHVEILSGLNAGERIVQ
jgi:RND family efflux transporter MFP subunit